MDFTNYQICTPEELDKIGAMRRAADIREQDEKLRDRFAIAAITGLLAGSEHTRETDASDHAYTAYYIADEMLKARKERRDRLGSEDGHLGASRQTGSN